MCNDDNNILKNSVTQLKGVGEVREKQFEKLGVKNIYDVITYYPREYEDRSVLKKIGELEDGDNCSFIGTIDSKFVEIKANKLTIYKVRIKDDTGDIILVFYNQKFLKKVLLFGQTFLFYGSVTRTGRNLEVKSPIYERYYQGKLENSARIVPVYSSTFGLSQNAIRGTIKNALNIGIKCISEFMPRDILDKLNLLPIKSAITNIHYPKDFESFHLARRRLVFDEFFLLQLALLGIKNLNNTPNIGLHIKKDTSIDEFIEKLPYKLTNAQLRTISEIFNDMESGRIMNRLVQGDVGSGKTIVAIIALLNVVKNGYQGVFLAPTEILARQHFELLVALLSDLGINIQSLTGSMRKKQKEILLRSIRLGEVDILVGTHAILQESVEFLNIGLVITDEQHRFGVKQRAILAQKGLSPHVLAMSATPIPRTLALILYGDLDVSIIDELPPGRKPVKTLVIDEDKRERMNGFIREKVKEGRQIYIVCPLVEESEQIEAKSAVILADELKSGTFSDLRVELIYGKMKPAQKDQIMEKFKDGELDVLISTTVIEVGVNVPNATIMVIENAERFGLSTLHQLRGRVGRGDKESFCILVTQNMGKVNQERMKIMKSTNDGFVVSEKDLELRGTGDFFGTRQHGIPDFKIANIYKDMNILKEAQEEAIKVIEKDALLENEENRKLKEKINETFFNRLQSDITLN